MPFPKSRRNVALYIYSPVPFRAIAPQKKRFNPKILSAILAITRSAQFVHILILYSILSRKYRHTVTYNMHRYFARFGLCKNFGEINLLDWALQKFWRSKFARFGLCKSFGGANSTDLGFAKILAEQIRPIWALQKFWRDKFDRFVFAKILAEQISSI